MDLPQLDQDVQLARGDAAHVARAVRLVQRELLHRDPRRGQRLLAGEALSLKPLSRLLKALARPIDRDKVPLPPARPGKPRKLPKPHALRVRFDELTALRLLYARLLATADQEDDDDPPGEPADVEARALVLATALGKFHQRSLNLATHITLPPALAARQGSLFA